MGKIIVKNAVERKIGHIYYINMQGDIIEERMNVSCHLDNKATIERIWRLIDERGDVIKDTHTFKEAQKIKKDYENGDLY